MMNSASDTLEIESRRDYLITTPKNEFYERLNQLRHEFVVLCVLDEKCQKIFDWLSSQRVCQLHENTVEQAQVVVTTPKRLLRISHGTKLLVILEDPHLLVPFGYSKTLDELRSRGLNFIALSDKILGYDFLTNPIVVAHQRKCFVKADDEQQYKILFSVIKFNIFNGDLAVIAATEPVRHRIRLFLRIFGYKNWKNVYLPEDTFSASRMVVFSSTDLVLSCVDAIYLSPVDIPELKEIKFDYSKVENYEYKIKDVLRSLSRDVCNKRKDVDIRKFTHLNNILSVST